jgi:hypothetical protein
MSRWFDGYRALTLESIVLLSLVRAGLVVFPFRFTLRAVAWCGTRRDLDRCTHGAAIARVSRAVHRAIRIVPQGGHCLTSALTAKVLLARLGVAADLRIGVAREAAPAVAAHAWLEVDGEPVFGLTPAELPKYSLLPHLDRTPL